MGQSRLCHVLLPMAATAVLGSDCLAQACEPTWLAGDPLLGVSDLVWTAVRWDPDGPGPRSPWIIFGGRFEVAGDVIAHNIAAWDPEAHRWLSLGTGTNGDVVTLRVLSDGSLVAGGSFTQAGTVPCMRIARWDGANWSALGDGPVTTAAQTWTQAICELRDGTLVAGGMIRASPGGFLSRWNGRTWTPIPVSGGVSAIVEGHDGSLYVGGSFGSFDGVAMNSIGRWDGRAWAPLGAGLTGDARAMEILADGSLLVGGSFGTAGGNNVAGIARWDGQSWQQLDGAITLPYGSSPTVRSLTRLPGGDLLIGGEDLSLGDASHAGLVRWNGTTWTDMALGENNAALGIATLDDGRVFVGGALGAIDGVVFDGVGTHDGQRWTPLGAGTTGTISTVSALPEGGVVVGGGFTTIGGVPAGSIAINEAGRWRALGEGLDGGVQAIAARSSRSIVAGGARSYAVDPQGTAVNHWNGDRWTGLGHISGTVYSLLHLGDGMVIAGGQFTLADGTVANNVARWNGGSWAALGSGVRGSSPLLTGVWALARAANGDIIAGGAFTTADGAPAASIARWDGGAWHPIGSGVADAPGTTGVVSALLSLPNGDLVVGGRFITAGGVEARNIARWNGSQWSPIGEGLDSSVLTLAVLPSGELVAGGSFDKAGAGATRFLAVWNGSGWRTLKGGTNGPVASLAVLTDGTLCAGGGFTIADDQVSASFARLGCTPCYANCDESTELPALGLTDLTCFLDRFRAGDAYANCDGSTGSPLLSAADFVCFLNTFRAGCP